VDNYKNWRVYFAQHISYSREREREREGGERALSVLQFKLIAIQCDYGA